MRALARAVAALTLAAPALASERQPSLRELEGELMCPTCDTTLAESRSPVAERMRVFIRARIAAGDSKGEIKDALVDEFGEAVLASPPKRGFNLLAWLLPAVALLGGGAAIALGTRRWSRRRDPEPAPAVPFDPVTERRLDDELARYEG